MLSTESRGFSLVELLTVMLVGALLLTAFAGFYRSEQRAFRHHQIEIETSQELRTALDQMSRDLRDAGRNLTGAAPAVGIVTANSTATRVDFDLDENDNGTITDSGERKQYCYNSAARQLLVCEPYGQATCSLANANCRLLAANISSASFAYGTAVSCPAPEPTPGTVSRIPRVDISLTANRQNPVAGLGVNRTEVETVRIRNACP
jgi:prepilin-type N-terminal cleavage/methylation domain-containing protein